jgi:glyoxylase-like metal-dependent hydrolase (beta-lactamase superfamily II)
MLQVTTHEDVTQLCFTTWRSRLSGMRVSAFVVRGVLIDSGFPSVAPDLARWLDAHPVGGAAITHYHEDHSGGAAMLARRGVPMWMSEQTRPMVARPKPVLFYRRFSWGKPQAVPSHAPFALPAGLTAIPTPGHSEDHHVLFDAETGTVFGGDLFIGVKVRLAHATEDARVTAASVRRVLALKPQRFFDAHRGLLDQPLARLAAKADWIEDTVARAERLIAEGLDDATIARRVLGTDRLSRWYTGGDYTMGNWVRGLRSHAPLA